jgi:single-stranded-DNA-specific exonuclease
MTEGKRWKLYPQNFEISSKISNELSLSPVLGQLLLNREIRSLSDAKSFIYGYNADHVQFPIKILESAKDLIQNCIENKQSILIYGDYDVDGMTSTTMMVTFLRQAGATVKYFLPHRFHHGYGLHHSVVDMIKKEPFSLLITLDCGVTNVAEINAIKDQTDASVLVIDHHTLPDIIPRFDAMINPRELDPDHHLYHLCTAGIVYQFGKYLEQNGFPTIKSSVVVDLAALGTIADIATLKGVNRDITREGLKQLSTRNNIGIKSLLAQAECEKPFISPTEVGFVIAPRLNAAGRLDTALLGVQLLLSPDEESAEIVSKKLELMNKNRREIDQSIFQESKKKVGDISQQKAIVLSGKDWHAGVIGITASKVVECFHRPAVIIAVDDKVGRGSARSIGNVNIYRVLKECKDYFIDFGGHKQAAGFSILPENVEPFKLAFQEKANELIDVQDLRPIMSVDMKLAPIDMTLDLAESLDLLQPFGQGNAMPVFYTDELRVIDCRTVGDGSHIKATFTDSSGKVIIDGIGFGLSAKMPLFQKRDIAVAFHLTINEWKNVRRPQLQIVDVK